MKRTNFPTGLFKFLVGFVFEASTEAFKVQVAKTYLKLIDGSRVLMIQMVLMIFLIAVASLGFVMIPVTLCLFMPWDMKTKAIVSITCSAIFALVPLIALMYSLSEKRWLRTLGDKK
jgi:hypothetical protein